MRSGVWRIVDVICLAVLMLTAVEGRLLDRLGQKAPPTVDGRPALPPVPPMPVSFADWHCGSSGFSKTLAFDEIGNTCPSHAAALNHCCAVHDDCYGQQLGQEKCDVEFCQCNRKALRIPTKEAKNCRAPLAMACTFVGMFGSDAYENSNYSDPILVASHVPVVEYVPKTSSDIEVGYSELYSLCPFVNITLSSCASNYNLCLKTKSADFCVPTMCDCLLDAGAADVAHQRTCTAAVNLICEDLIDYAKQSTGRIHLILYTLLGVLMIAMIALLVFYKRFGRRSRPFEDGKCHIQTVDSARSIMPLLAGA
ncbi:unnamed protein product [Caenorhabditis auriculariae]|uniref:Phospholipase A2 n=1 Tax=Caenorhabditis auriculariae TaxID=2777116 RepID=A0A8S1HQ29_9PELO|nr:unnamed protein product [Caenorhabditis auriculariae]